MFVDVPEFHVLHQQKFCYSEKFDKQVNIVFEDYRRFCQAGCVRLNPLCLLLDACVIACIAQSDEDVFQTCKHIKPVPSFLFKYVK